jgi:cytochrome oxidase Cu insertion factor (SCO1/SenC/PrrC family)
MRFKICALFVVILALSQIANALDRQEVKLEKKILSSTGKLEGITNIFFLSLKDSRFQYLQDWKDIEIAAVLENQAFVPVYAMRYKNLSGQLKYVVDTDGDLDFRNEAVLQFQPNDNLQIADALLLVQPADKKKDAHKVNYQIITSNDGYTYARISEYRQGKIHLGNRSYGLLLRPRFRNSPLYNLSGGMLCLLDLDQDGSFSSMWRMSGEGKISPTEEIAIALPFFLDGKKLKVVQLDAAGTHLVVESTTEETAISLGFKAPDFTVVDADGKIFNLKQLKGKIVFLEFWSVSCPFCKQILPQVNSVIKDKAGKDFVALAIAREGNRGEIETHLKQHPRNAIVAANEKSTWQTYNDQGVTPAFYLIDQQGVVRFSGFGSSPEQIRILDRLIEGLRSK